MKKNIFIILFLYWIIATISILNHCSIFPILFEIILFPGYFFGFALGYSGGTLHIIIGQIINLAILLAIGFVINVFILAFRNIKQNNDDVCV